MRIPILTESYIFRVALLIAASAALGAVSSAIAGVLLFAAGMLAALAFEMLNPRRNLALKLAFGEPQTALAIAFGLLALSLGALFALVAAQTRSEVPFERLQRAGYWTPDVAATFSLDPEAVCEACIEDALAFARISDPVQSASA